MSVRANQESSKNILMAPHIHLPSKFFDALDIQRIIGCRDENQVEELLINFQDGNQPDTAVFIAMNNEHAMIFTVPYQCFKEIHLKDAIKAEIGRDYGLDADEVNEQWYSITKSLGHQALLYHLTVEVKEYIIERYQAGTARKLVGDNRQFSVGKMWNRFADRKYYFFSTKFNHHQLNLIVIWLMKRNDKYISLKKGYMLMQNDCLEFAKDFIRALAKFEHRNQNNLEEVMRKVSEMTITKDSVLASSEFSSRNVTVAGLSVGTSYNTTIKTLDATENKQTQKPAVNKNGWMKWMFLGSIITAATFYAVPKMWKQYNNN